MVNRSFIFGFALSLTLILGCGSIPYKWYGLDLPSYSEGRLLGPTEEDDLPMAFCRPSESEQGRCVVMLAHEFERLYTDLIEMRQRLEACEEDR